MNILTYGDEKLVQKCKPVESISLELHKTIQNMFDLMYESKGIGLAAPQVGILERFFIVDIGDSIQHVFINPSLREGKNPTECIEGCLSFPNIFTKVVRYKNIKVTAQNLNGDFFELEAEGLLAQAIQHETDHLDGILLVDHANGLLLTDPF